MTPKALLAAAYFCAALTLNAQTVKEISVRQEGHFITRPDEGHILVSDNPVTKYRTVSYKTPSLQYEYVIDSRFQLISYKATVTDGKLAGIFMANQLDIRKTDTGYIYRKKRGNAGWEELLLPITKPVIYFGGIANFLQERLKGPEAKPESGKITCLIPPFLPVEVDFSIKKTTSDQIPQELIPLTKGKPPAHFSTFMAEARSIWLAEFRLTGLAWVIYPHPFCFALETDETPELLANWGGRTDTEDYFIVYAPASDPVSTVSR